MLPRSIFALLVSLALVSPIQGQDSDPRSPAASNADAAASFADTIRATTADGVYAEPAVERERSSEFGSDIDRSVFFSSSEGVGDRELSFRLDRKGVTDEPLSAAGESSEKGGAGWEFQFTPYVWAAGVKANAVIGSFESSGEVDFIDLAKKLDVGVMLHFEGRKERWGFMLDGLYMNATDDARARVGPFRVRGINIDGGLKMAILEAGVFYRFGEASPSFDALAGVRYISIDLRVDPGPLPTLSRDKDWVDPFIGGRFQLGLSERWSLSLRGDVGGFGVGSDLTWNVTALLGYRLSETTTLAIGYRHLDIDYANGNFEFDAQFSGPYLGLSFRF